MPSMWGTESDGDFYREEARNDRRRLAMEDFLPLCFVCGEQFYPSATDERICDECLEKSA